jgi:hypothetical protein
VSFIQRGENDKEGVIWLEDGLVLETSEMTEMKETISRPQRAMIGRPT